MAHSSRVLPERIVVLGHTRPLHQRYPHPESLPFHLLSERLATWSEHGGRDGRIVLGVTRFNLFKLDRLLRFLEGYLPALGEIALSPLQPRPLASLRAEVRATLSRLALDGRLLQLPLSIEVVDEGLEPLLLQLETTAPEEEPSRLRALGAVCETALRGPSRVLIDLTTVCNTNCVFCRAHNETVERRLKPTFLDWPLLEELLQDMKELEVEQVSLVGSGEPSLNPHLPAFLRRASEHGIAVDVSINGIRMPDELRQALLSPWVFSVTVSVSGPTPSSYEGVHPGHREDFARVVENCRRLAGEREGPAPPRLFMLHCINTHTVDELRQMVELCHEVGFDAVWVQMLHVDPQTAHLRLTPRQAEELPARLAEARALAEERGLIFEDFIGFQVENLDPDDGTWSKEAMTRLGCYVGWYFTYVCVDSYVNFCCGIKTVSRLGPARRLQEIWSSDAYDHLRFCAKFLDASRNVEAPQNPDLATRRFLLDGFCDCCDNHNFNEIIKRDLAESTLAPFLLPPPTETIPRLEAVTVSSAGLPPNTFVTGDPLRVTLRFDNPGLQPELFPSLYFFEGNNLFVLLFALYGPPASRARRGEWILDIARIPYRWGRMKLLVGLGTRESGTHRLFCREEAATLELAGTAPDASAGRFDLPYRLRLRPLDRPTDAPLSRLSAGSARGGVGAVIWGESLRVRFAAAVPPGANGFMATLEIDHLASGGEAVFVRQIPLLPGRHRVAVTFPRFPLLGDHRVVVRLTDENGTVLGRQRTALHVLEHERSPDSRHGLIGVPHRWRSRLRSP